VTANKIVMHSRRQRQYPIFYFRHFAAHFNFIKLILSQWPVLALMDGNLFQRPELHLLIMLNNVDSLFPYFLAFRGRAPADHKAK